MAYFRAIRHGNLAVVAPLVGLEGGIAAVAAVIILGAHLHTITAVALAVAVAGATLAGLQPGRRAATGAVWALVSATSFAATFVLLGRAGGLSPLGAVLVLRIVALVLLVAWRPRRIRSCALPRPALPAALVLGSLDVVAFSLFAAAAAMGSIAIASVSGAQFATFAAILGLLVLRQRLAVWQYAGLAMTLAAVSALAASA